MCGSRLSTRKDSDQTVEGAKQHFEDWIEPMQ